MSGLVGNPLFFSTTGSTQYQIERSLRFNSSDSAYCGRSFGTPTTQGTFTFSTWVKRSALGSTQQLFGVSTNHSFGFASGDALNLTFGGTSALTTTAVFRDPGAWYHIVWTQSGTSHTIYVNNVSVGTATATSSVFNTAVAHQIGAANTANYFNGYLADIHFIDGQALTPSSFTEVSATTGQLIPKAYSGSFGTNGFWLKFSDNSNNTAATLGKDYSGNGHNWTPTNLSTSDSISGPAAPILNTNAVGTLVTSGVRADSSASSLVLAIAGATSSGLDLTDQIPSGRTQAAQSITNNGVTANTTTSRFYGGSVNCANGQDIQVAANSGMVLGNTFTVEFWAQPTGAGNELTISTYGINASNGYVIMLGTGGARFRSNGTSDLIYSATINGWNHFAFVASGGNSKRIFVNGVLVASDSGTINASGSYTTYIGSSSANASGFRFFGQFQDYRIYKGLAKYTANFTPLSFSANNDSLVDTPSSTGTDTSAGGEVRGNYATFNPTESSTSGTKTLTNGNLDVLLADANAARLTIPPIQGSGKYQWEITIGSKTATYYQLGLNLLSMVYATGDLHATFRSDGNLSNTLSGSWSGTGVSYTSGDVITVTYDNATNTCAFYKNGVYSATFTVSGTPQASLNFGVFYGGSGNTNYTLNAGQRPFAYPVSGFKALCDTNLPAPVVAKPNTVFDVALWTGNSTNNRAITGFNYSPDLVWIKNRSSSGSWNVLFDVVRGAGNQLATNQTDAELASASNVAGKVSSFDAAGFTLQIGNSSYFSTNETGSSYVGWCWDAGSSTVTNTQGSITSQVRANPSAGFSIVTYTGNGSNNATVGHGLNINPGMVIVKSRSAAYEWPVYHSSLTAGNNLFLHLTNAQNSVSGTITAGGIGAVSSTTFTCTQGIGNINNTNASSATYVAYCFAPVAGYSSFGSWQNNGSTDGTFVYLGFRPKFILLKNTDNVERWYIMDSSRHTYNVAPADATKLQPNLADAEGTGFANTATIDFLSNGFKIRTTNTASGEISFGTRNYIYAAFAESPFQFARAR